MFRSPSGPGLSISTSTANILGSQSSVPPPGGGNQGKSLFGNTTTSQPQQSFSLFGAPKANPMMGNQQTGGVSASTNQIQGGGLFGSSQRAQPGTTNIFGNNASQQPQPQPGGSLSSSMFFQNQNTSTNLFSNTQGTNTLFGPAQSAAQPQPSNIQHAVPSVFSGSIGQQNHQQTVPGVRISVNELRPTTRFNDLHEELQKAIELVDAFIVNKIQWHEQCEAVNNALEDMCQQMPPDVDHCAKSLNIVQQALENDAELIASAKRIVKADALDAKLSFKVVNNLKLPQQFHHTNLWSTVSVPQHSGPNFYDDSSDDGSSRSLVEYFSKHADDMSQSLASYKRNIAEVEAYLKDIEVKTLQQVQRISSSRSRDGGARSDEDQVRELSAVLRVFENGILGVATKVGAAREIVQDAMLGQPDDMDRSALRRSRAIS